MEEDYEQFTPVDYGQFTPVDYGQFTPVDYEQFTPVDYYDYNDNYINSNQNGNYASKIKDYRQTGESIDNISFYRYLIPLKLFLYTSILICVGVWSFYLIFTL